MITTDNVGHTGQVPRGGARDRTEGSRATAWHTGVISLTMGHWLDAQPHHPTRGDGSRRAKTFVYPTGVPVLSRARELARET